MPGQAGKLGPRLVQAVSGGFSGTQGLEVFDFDLPGKPGRVGVGPLNLASQVCGCKPPPPRRQRLTGRPTAGSPARDSSLTFVSTFLSWGLKVRQRPPGRDAVPA